jgi:MoxR-like ATPase
MQKIVDVHFPTIEQELVDDAMKAFYEVRDTQGIKKKPSTSELIDWIRLLKIGNQKISDSIPKNELPNLGALLKNEQDIELLIRMAKMGMRRY